MNNFLKGLGVSLLVLIALLYYIHGFEGQKSYTDISVYGVLMFSVLSILLYIFLSRSVYSSNKQLFLSITLANMLVKMVFSIVLLLVYKEVKQPLDGKFILPFLTIYLIFTIFETWFMVRLADEKP